MAKDAPTATATPTYRDTSKPQTEAEIKRMYEWDGTEKDCPTDLVVNAGNQTLIVGAMQQLPFDNPRIDPGDRRRGDYYLKLASHPDFNGLQRVNSLGVDRLADLERTRKLRSGDEPEDWVKEAWKAKEDNKEG